MRKQGRYSAHGYGFSSTNDISIGEHFFLSDVYVFTCHV